MNPWLWTGAVRTHGAPSVALVCSFEEVAQALIDYAQVGVTQFILSGWPKLDEMISFGKEILPRIQKLEAGLRRLNDPFQSRSDSHIGKESLTDGMDRWLKTLVARANHKSNDGGFP